MELRQVRAFVTIVDEGHVGRAAERLHVTQPTLSRQVAALERAVGVPLFDRRGRALTLTPAGAVFEPGARDLVRRSDDLVVSARRAHRGELGVLRIGFVQSATFAALPSMLRAFREAWPSVRVEVTAMTTLRQVSALADDALDVGLLRPPVRDDLSLRTLSRDPLVVALPGGHRLSRRRRVSLAELADEPFVLYGRESGPAVHDTIVGFCRDAGFSPRIVQEAVDVQTIVALVAANLGVSLLIAPTPQTDSSVVFRPVAEDLPPWEMALAWSRGNQSPVLARLLETVG
ncbi:LysR family transcriptional regulator [Actinophytocola algeriensis]|uniref:DNA-binding transcriptional LysR family regulator n=1 Tax=Actinophytocola algeriensis TaxID=1768010 RepID=A0A7W7PZS0_9PSEU|nr:LysR family transcriptional regulator [Actinophytocola algeriensis]MBB4904345.1 DNA-binding transcriptional LysR family regulator [Actinophytocola algeriensis]MBE1476797.1 DNA-binding transcriptional LysR family regulator [Actinophytocola algeriensis]